MKPEKATKEYLASLNDLTLSEAKKTQMSEELLAYARLHSLPEGEMVREAGDDRLIKQVPPQTNWRTSLLFTIKKTTIMPIAIMLMLMVGGGTSFAAQGALPGDFLYPVKTEVNEKIRSAFTFGADAEAELQADLLEKRVAEAQALEAEGTLTGERAVETSATIATQTERAQAAAASADATMQTSLVTRIDAAILAFNQVVGNDTRLAISVDQATSAAVGTMLRTGEVDVESLRASTQARATGLAEVLTDAEAEISAAVQTELETKLTDAQSLLVAANAQAEAEARQSLMAAADLLGEIEARLTTLGEATIDTSTGAIIDINFAVVPDSQLRINADGTTASDTNSVDADTNTNVDIELDTNSSAEGSDLPDSSLDGELKLEATSGLRL